LKSIAISLYFLPHDKIKRSRVFWDVTRHLVSVFWCLTSFRNHSASQFHNPAVQHPQQNYAKTSNLSWGDRMLPSYRSTL